MWSTTSGIGSRIPIPNWITTKTVLITRQARGIHDPKTFKTDFLFYCMRSEFVVRPARIPDGPNSVSLQKRASILVFQHTTRVISTAFRQFRDTGADRVETRARICPGGTLEHFQVAVWHHLMDRLRRNLFSNAAFVRSGFRATFLTDRPNPRQVSFHTSRESLANGVLFFHIFQQWAFSDRLVTLLNLSSLPSSLIAC
jgi:hypothetical protein